MPTDDDPTFSLREEREACNGTSSRSVKMVQSEEEHRARIVAKTKQALAISEQFTELLVKRMQQTPTFSLGPREPSSRSKAGRKRKLKSPAAETKGAKSRKCVDGSSAGTDCTYMNTTGLEVSVRQPKLLEGAVMRDYQLDGLEWLVALDLNGANGILADEMGLGKTLQVISLICFLVEMGVGKEAPFLVIGPLSTLTNWMAEFTKFAPKIPTILYHGSKTHRASLRGEIVKLTNVNGKKTYPVIITSYEVPLHDPNLRKINWRYLIVDEGHRLKNHKCLLVKELRRYQTTNRLLLTGTPLQNNMTELWSLLNFILPNIVNDMDVFECWFDPSFFESTDVSKKIVEAEEKDQVLTTLHKILRPFLLRRVKTDVGLNLPPKKEVIVYAQMTEWQNRLYSAVVNKTLSSLQGKEPELSDPVALERSARHARPQFMSDSALEEDFNFEALETSGCSEVELEKENTPLARRLGTRGGLLKIGDYRYLARGVPLNAIRDGPMYFDESSPVEEKKDRLLEGLAQPDEEFVTEMKIANPISVLRQICNHPYLASYPVLPGTKYLKTDENIVERSGKMKILDALLTRLKSNGHKVLLFSNFCKMLNVLEDYLILRGYNYTRLDGSRDLSDRQVNIQEFSSNDDVFIFLISTRAGGLGINLVAADTVIIYDSDWNPQVDLQAQDRCHRIGQTKPVVVYRFIVKDTIDQRILDRAVSKKQLEKLVIQYGKFQNVKAKSTVCLEELQNLLEVKNVKNEVFKSDLAYTDQELDALCDRIAIFADEKEEPLEAEAPSIEGLSDAESESSDSRGTPSCSSELSCNADNLDSVVPDIVNTLKLKSSTGIENYEGRNRIREQ